MLCSGIEKSNAKPIVLMKKFTLRAQYVKSLGIDLFSETPEFIFLNKFTFYGFAV